MKKIIALILAGVMMLGLVACSGTQAGKDNDGEKTSKWDHLDWTKGADASGGDVTLRVTSWRQYDKDYYEEIARRFEEKYDWIDVQIDITPNQSAYYSNIQSDLMSGEAPDVMDIHLGNIPDYIKEGVIAPQTDFDYLERYKDSVKTATTFDGDNYGFLLAYNYFGFIYNVDAFNECGISVPTTPEELVAAVNTLKNAGYGGIAYPGQTLGGKIYRNILQISLGQDIQDMYKDIDTGKLTDITTIEGVESAFKTMKYYTDNDIYYNAFEGIGLEAANSLFAQKKSAILYNGTYALGEAKDTFPDINFGYFPIPTHSGNSISPAEGAQSACISATSKNLGAAKLWVEFLATPEISAYYCENSKMLSSLEGVTIDDEITNMYQHSTEDFVIHTMKDIKHEAYWYGLYEEILENILLNGADWKEETDLFRRKLEELDLSTL